MPGRFFLLSKQIFGESSAPQGVTFSVKKWERRKTSLPQENYYYKLRSKAKLCRKFFAKLSFKKAGTKLF